MATATLSSPQCESLAHVSDDANSTHGNGGRASASSLVVDEAVPHKQQKISSKAFLQAQPFKTKRFHRKRRHSMNEDGTGGKRHRKPSISHQKKVSVGDIILPTNFLLGGNISDPLNLNSLLDENVNKALNAVTPTSSPLPPRSSTINIVIPPDMTDPLGLNSAADDDQDTTEESSFKTDGDYPSKEGRKQKKKKKRRKSQHEKSLTIANKANDFHTADEEYEATNHEDSSPVSSKHLSKPHKSKHSKSTNMEASKELGSPHLHVEVPDIVVCDPIVSPVVPQDVRRSSTSSSKSRRKRGSSGTCGKQLSFQTADDTNDANKTSDCAAELADTVENNLIDSQPVEASTSLDSANSTYTAKITATDPSLNSHIVMPRKRTKKISGSNHHTFKPKPLTAKFQYGNYNQYYGYRNPNKFADERMSCLEKDWFKDKDVLDVGCNAGHLTLLIARDFEPRKIVGVDIDDNLIKMARKNIRHYATAHNGPALLNCKYPESLPVQFGPIFGPPVETGDSTAKFPNNVVFLKGNYVPEKDEVLQFQEPEYDVILCFSVTKWIHLNWGDKGLKETFQRFFKQLRPGGKLILEPQDWKSYQKKKKLTQTIFNNYNSIKLVPEAFPGYLIKQIGFERVQYLNVISNDNSKGFQRQIQLYYKPE